MRLSCKPSPLGPPLGARCFLPQVEASVFLLLRRQAALLSFTHPAEKTTALLSKHQNGEGKLFVSALLFFQTIFSALTQNALGGRLFLCSSS